MELWQAVVLAIVEGFTEYLPISSTGHIIIASSLLGINEASFTKDYTVMVQFGAILSVLVLYWRRFLAPFQADSARRGSGLRFYLKLIVAFFPAAALGLLLKDRIDALLGNVTVVAVALIVGGVVLLFAEKWLTRPQPREDIDEVPYSQAALIGLIQCLAFVPGVSRSAATILGGLSQRLSMKAAAEFSFFLAVPTLTGASFLKLLKLAGTIEPAQLQVLLVGNAVSFIVGLLTIRGFIGYLSRGGFRWFGWYRITVGLLILVLAAAGVNLSVL
ncbi:MAG: undecaprenyl-diphosphate phosphatase [Oligoflexia bacterium]|nr:undecaprenyl-diphosphate phosphatase [Oligoflexia bacterium]